MRLKWTAGTALALLILAGCTRDVGPDPIVDPDVGVEDTGGDDTDTAEPDAELDADPDTSEPDADTGEPEERLCPESMADSCIAEALNCMGDASSVSQCVVFGQVGEPGHRTRALFNNGAVVEYREADVGEGPRLFRAAFGPDGDRCYNLLALEEGDSPTLWNLSEQLFGSFTLAYHGSQLEVDCGGDGMERCTVARYESAFAMPFSPPAQGCEPFTVDDLCELDTECGAGQACCRPDDDSLRQCLDLEFCLSQREPVPCETSAQCSVGETCSRCTFSGIRQCVPDEIVENSENTLGCVEDGCQPGDGTCQGDRICCDLGNVLQCLFPTECSSAPDPNPVCNPDEQQACPSASQQCCFESQAQEFRCLTNVPFCVTEVCFSTADCPGTEECCGVDAQGTTAGSCFSTCEPPDLSCEEQEDCFGEQHCCIAPGLSDGQCVSNVMACEFVPCTEASDCAASQECCSGAPLTESVCLSECP